jgi:hypothetical protein
MIARPEGRTTHPNLSLNLRFYHGRECQIAARVQTLGTPGTLANLTVNEMPLPAWWEGRT